MKALERAAAEFLALDRIAVFGVSRDSRQAANLICRKLRETGHAVFAVNPNAERVEGDVAYPGIASIPGGVDGAVIVTAPGVAISNVEACAATGVRRVWLHQGIGRGSVSPAVVERCRALGLRAIPGACPMMFCEPVDPGHRCIRWFKKVGGRLPDPLP